MYMARKRKSRWSWRHQVASFNAAITLATWRWRTQWFLLLVTGIGMTTAIVLVGSLPLFASVMTTAGVRNVVRASSTNAQLLATVQLPGLGSQAVTTTAG